MKPVKFFIFMAIAIATITSCKKNNDDDPGGTNGNTVTADSIILSHRGGFPATLNSSNFLLASAMLMQDTITHDTVRTPHNFTVTLSNADHNKVKHLLSNIPNSILQENHKHYGTKYTVDCSFTILTAYINGQTYQWEFEDCTDSMPAHARQYGTEVSQAIQYLKND